MATLGAVLFTVNAVLLGPAAALVLPAVSVTTPAGRLMVSVPLPVHEEIVTVRLLRPEPLKALLQLAVPVAFKMISLLANVTFPTATESEKVSAKLAVPVAFTTLGVTLPKAMVGSVWSRTTVRAKVTLVLPARSTWLTLTTLLPSPELKVTVAV